MPLPIGTKLGPYEIVAQIGAGGMGEVYRASDPRLGRDVAIKVSREKFTIRFAREARAVAALNHPNIAHLYDVGPDFLVMELVEGPTLAERIKQGPIPTEEALGIARQIAEALRAAHEKNIVHRDLKPGNVKIRPDGVVKVLDFGLAKMGGTPTVKSEDSPTISLGPTQAGVIMGTPAYMAPEQARGRETDKKADIWAFGVVLYEMLTGKQLFAGETVSDTLAEVLKTVPDWEHIPVEARKLVRRCLEKDPVKRLQDIGDWDLLLEVGQVPDLPVTQVGDPRHFAWIPWAAAGVLALALAAALWTLWPRTVDRPLVRLDVDLGSDVALASPQGSDVALSPDGTRLVYVSQARLFTRRLDQPTATELPGTESAFAPFFSPDGQWIAFFSGSKLKKISVQGGGATTLCDASTARGGGWSENGMIMMSPIGSGPLMQVSDGGGKPAAVMDLDRDHSEVTQRWPQVLPGGQAVLFTSHISTSGFDDASIAVASLKDHHRKTLIQGGTYGRYLPSGHLIYVNRGTLFAIPFDLSKLEVRGTPTPVLSDVTSSGTGSAQFDFSRNGTFLYRSGLAGTQLTVQWLSEDGKTAPLLSKPGAYARPVLSPDGRRLVLMAGDDVWVYDLERESLERRTFGNGPTNPVWSADGRFLIFQNIEGLGWTRSDGASMPQTLMKSKNQLVPFSVSPDGKTLAYMEIAPGSSYDLWTVPIESEGSALRAGKPEPFRVTPADERHPAFSPDGKWLAYSSGESGSFQVYVRAFPDKGGQYQISVDGGVYPEWSRTAHELFFRTEDNQIMVAKYSIKGDAFQPDKPRAWTNKRIASVGVFRSFDLAPDGKRVAALMPAEGEDAQQAGHHVIFLENFFDELRRRVK